MYAASSNLLSKSGLDAAAINKLLLGKGKLSNLGEAFMEAENKQGINAHFALAQAILETGWGNSVIARNKNNLFGMNAYDSNPYGSAASYASPQDSVRDWATFMLKNYLTPGGPYYSGPTPSGIARHYASDPEYANKIVKLMNQIAEQTGTVPGEAPADHSSIVQGTATNVYVAKPGDSMWKIAQNHGMTLHQLEVLNPHAGHPAGNFALIWPKDKFALNAPGQQELAKEGK